MYERSTNKKKMKNGGTTDGKLTFLLIKKDYKKTISKLYLQTTQAIGLLFCELVSDFLFSPFTSNPWCPSSPS